MKYLFFDTETTGKPIRYNAPMTDVNNWPRITQIAWVVYNEQEELVESKTSLIKPDGWQVPKEQFFIDNNMSTERCEAEGLPLSNILEIFTDHAKNCEYLIAHNISFDYNVLGAEMIRYKASVGKQLKQVCTMKSSTNHCQLPGPYGFKWPKLEELHQVLFGCGFDGAHDALSDVITTAKCFFELKRLGVIVE